MADDDKKKPSVVSTDKKPFVPKLDPTQADLFDMKTGARIVAKDQTDLEHGIKTGRYGYGASRVLNVFNPDGELQNVDSKYLRHYLNQGYTLETPTQASVRQYVDEHKGLSGDAQVALGQFADEALLGLPETIMDHTQSDEDIAKREAVKKDHQIANALGGIGGFAASTVVGAPLFEAAGAAGKAVRGSILGEQAVRNLAPEAAGTIAKGVSSAVERGIAPEAAGEAASSVIPRRLPSPAIPLSERTATDALPQLGTGARAGTIPEAGSLALPPGARAPAALPAGSIPRGLPSPPASASNLAEVGRDGTELLGRNGERLSVGQPPAIGQGAGLANVKGIPLPGQAIELAGEEGMHHLPGRAPWDISEAARKGLPGARGLGREGIAGAGEAASEEGLIGPFPKKAPWNIEELGRNGLPKGASPFTAAEKDAEAVAAEKIGASVGETGREAERANDIPFPKETTASARAASKKLPDLDTLIARAKTLEVGTQLGRAGMPVAEAIKVAPGLARQILANAAGTGVEGAILAAPQAFTEAVLGDPEAAAEDLMHGVGFGAAFGIAGSLAKGALSAVSRKIPTVAAEQAFRSLHFSNNQRSAAEAALLPGGTKGVGQALLDNDLIRNVRESWVGYGDRISQARDDVGSRIGDLYTRLDNLAEGSTGLLSGEALGSKVRSELIKPLTKQLGKKGIVNKLENLASELEVLGGDKPMSFTQLHEYRVQLDDMIYKEGALGVIDPAKKEMQKVRGLLTDELENKGTKVAKDTDFQFKTMLDERNMLYRQLNVANRAVAKSIASSTANRVFSPSDYGVGLVSGIAGGPLGVGTSIAGATIHKLVREEGNGIIARSLNYLADTGERKGLLIAENASNKTMTKLNSIPKMLTNIANKGKPIALAAGLRLADHKKMHDEVSKMMADPEALRQAVEIMSTEISHNGAPTVGQIYAQKQLNTLNYIQASMPKPAAPTSGFQKDNWKASSSELRDFGNKLEVIDNPFIAFYHIQAGTLTPAHVESLQVNFPKTYKRMLGQIKAYETSPHVKILPYQVRQGIALMTGDDYHAPTKNAGLYQSLYGTQKSRPLAAGKMDSLPSFQTDVSSMANGGSPKKRGR